ncbi:MAG: hypothetical protein ABJH08_09585 [Balneola sp.]
MKSSIATAVNYLFIRGILLMSLFLSFNQATSAKQTTDSTQTTTISPDVRVPSESRLQEISSLDKYRYNEPQATLSLWDKILIWLQELFQKMLQNPWVEYFLKGSAILIFVVILFALVNQILKGEIRSAITGKRDRSLLNFNIDDGDIDSSKIDSLIKQALEKKNYGLAVRLLYQKSLLLLSEHELINYKQDKTNYEYLKELNDHPSANYFDRLTYFHEYIDYGHFEIDEERFKTVNNIFLQFQRSLHA